MNEASTVLEYWFATPGSPEYDTFRKLWFTKSDAIDQEIRERFGALIERALRGELAAWANAPQTALAQIILLDQFTRNAFRDTPRAFAGDAAALNAATAMVGLRQDEQLGPLQRSFVYMPFEHAESMAAQNEAVRLFTRLAAETADMANSLDYALRHRAMIERFGRFPHRNAILGRRSTAEEESFLKEPGSRF